LRAAKAKVENIGGILWSKIPTAKKMFEHYCCVPPLGGAVVASLFRGFTPTAMLFHPFGVQYIRIFPQVVEDFELWNRQPTVDDLQPKYVGNLLIILNMANSPYL